MLVWAPSPDWVEGLRTLPEALGLIINVEAALAFPQLLVQGTWLLKPFS